MLRTCIAVGFPAAELNALLLVDPEKLSVAGFADDLEEAKALLKERVPGAVAERIDEQFVGDQFAVKDRVLGNGLCLERTAHTLARRSERPNIVHLKLHLSHHRFLQGLPQFLQDLAFHARDVHL